MVDLILINIGSKDKKSGILEVDFDTLIFMVKKGWTKLITNKV